MPHRKPAGNATVAAGAAVMILERGDMHRLKRGYSYFALALLAATLLAAAQYLYPVGEIDVIEEVEAITLASFAQVWLGFAAAVTMILGAAYTLWMYKRVIFGDIGNAQVAELQDLNRREFWLLALVALAVLAMGVWPRPFIDVMAGLTRFSGEGDNEFRFAASLGAGAKLLPSPRYGIRMESRVFGTLVDAAGALACAGGCFLALSADVVWQWEFSAGLIVRIQ